MDENHLKSDSQKVLLIDGARQIGKSYIIRHVGTKLFENYIEIDLMQDFLGEKLFDKVKTVDDFYLQVSMHFGDKMKQKENTLIFKTPKRDKDSLNSIKLNFAVDNSEYINKICDKLVFGLFPISVK